MLPPLHFPQQPFRDARLYYANVGIKVSYQLHFCFFNCLGITFCFAELNKPDRCGSDIALIVCGGKDNTRTCLEFLGVFVIESCADRETSDTRETVRLFFFSATGNG